MGRVVRATHKEMTSHQAWTCAILLTAIHTWTTAGKIIHLQMAPLGCYKNPGSLIGALHKADLRVQECLAECIQINKRKAFIENRTLCLCGDELPGHALRVHDSLCNRYCHLVGQPCGGNGYLTAYPAECQDGFWGIKPNRICHRQCGNCAGADQNEAVVCDITSGKCSSHGCLPGWKGSQCKEKCLAGWFGPNCQHQCHCELDDHCDVTSGICSKNCSPGWEGLNCSSACPPGWYGNSCAQQCFCNHGSACDHVNGSCVHRCATGWTGQTCLEQVTDLDAFSSNVTSHMKGASTGNLTGLEMIYIITGTCVFAGLVIVLLCFLLNHWFKKHHVTPPNVKVRYQIESAQEDDLGYLSPIEREGVYYEIDPDHVRDPFPTPAPRAGQSSTRVMPRDHSEGSHAVHSPTRAMARDHSEGPHAVSAKVSPSFPDHGNSLEHVLVPGPVCGYPGCNCSQSHLDLSDSVDGATGSSPTQAAGYTPTIDQ